MTTELATFNENALAAFQNASAALSGEQKLLLKFQKGDWYAGQDNEEIPIGTKLAANIMEAEWGWVRWHDNKPVERRMTLIASGTAPPPRDALGHDDEALWDRDDQGRPRDPWQRMIEIPVRELSGERREMILSGGSRGHEGACKALFKEFGDGMRSNLGKIPVIELRSDKYNHPKYGIVKTPAMPLVSWLDPAAPAATTKKGKF